METSTVHELIGYVGSGLVVISLMMRSLLRLRVINLVGAAIFTVYGVLIEAPPVWLVNGAIVLIDVYHLRTLLGGAEPTFEILEVDADTAYLRRFLTRHRDEIAASQPSFTGLGAEHRVFLILHELAPVGVFAARPDASEATAAVDLDYVIPGYRDLKPGRFLYADPAVRRRLGVERVVTAPGSSRHRQYLERIGFERQGNRYVRDLG